MVMTSSSDIHSHKAHSVTPSSCHSHKACWEAWFPGRPRGTFPWRQFRTRRWRTLTCTSGVATLSAYGLCTVKRRATAIASHEKDGKQKTARKYKKLKKKNLWAQIKGKVSVSWLTFEASYDPPGPGVTEDLQGVETALWVSLLSDKWTKPLHT